MKSRVLLDIDGVLANFHKGFSEFLNSEYGCTIDTNSDPKYYDIRDWGGGACNIDVGEAIPRWIMQGGFSKVPAFDGIKDFVSNLSQLCDIYVVTARVGDWQEKLGDDVADTIRDDTAEWLERHGIDTEKLFFEHNKVDFCKNRGISIMVEDKIQTALDGAKNGISTVLIDHPYNDTKINRFKIYRASSFDEALGHIKRLVGV